MPVADAVDGFCLRVVLAIDATGLRSKLTLRLDGAALPAQLGRVRRVIAAWLAEGGLDPDTIDDVVLATNEALANAADHAFAGADGEVVLRADRTAGDVLRVMVHDTGRWRPPPTDPGFRGHGMSLMAGLAQRCRVRRGRTGTTVEMSWRLPGRPNPA
ncbi:ATP-binding protein [Pseudonocardia sp. CA-107938]|uniref:ATP-binding protein n=1 Tax=Pseudonocardia sp. CA-107938 TaxID=3240021 RepID=UPI003D916494